jgi:hypothetical protein
VRSASREISAENFFPIDSFCVQFFVGPALKSNFRFTGLPSVKIEIPRYSVVKVIDEFGLASDFVCVDLPGNGDELHERAVAMFSGRDEAQRFIATHHLTDWVPAFIGYTELREWLAGCHQNHEDWAVVNFHNNPQPEFVKTFRIADAMGEIDAIDAEHLESGEPVFVEGQSLLL